MIKAFEGLAANWWKDEERHYEETYHESDDDDWDAADIPTDDLKKDHNYYHLRVLKDYFDELEVLCPLLFLPSALCSCACVCAGYYYY